MKSSNVVPESQAKDDSYGGKITTKDNDKVPHGMIPMLKLKFGVVPVGGAIAGPLRSVKYIARTRMVHISVGLKHCVFSGCKRIWICNRT